MLPSSLSSIVKKTRGSLSRDEEGSKASSSNSFTFYKKKTSSSSSSNNNETPIDSINPSHDQNWTPVHIIASDEDLDAEKDLSGVKEVHEENVQETYHPNGSDKITDDAITTLNEATVSAHDPFQYAHCSKPVFIDTAKGDVLLGSDQKDYDPSDDTLDQLRMQAEMFLEDQKRKNAELLELERLELELESAGYVTSNPKGSSGELSFDVDESILCSSTLDEALGSFNEDGQEHALYRYSGPGPGVITHDSSRANFVKLEPTLVKELSESSDPFGGKHIKSEFDAAGGKPHDTNIVIIPGKIETKQSNHEDFCQETFANIGKVISVQNNEGCANKLLNSSLTCNEEPPSSSQKDKVFYLYSATFCIILVSLLLYMALSGGSDEGGTDLMTTDEEDEVIIEEISAYQNECPEESFHYAMYQFSNVVDKQDAQSQTDIPSAFSVRTIANIMLRGLVLFEIVQYSRNALTGGKEAITASTTKSKGREKCTKTPIKPKLQREVKSLEKKNIFVSSFVTDIVSPKDGTIETVKRSTRIKSAPSAQVNLLAEFGDAPKKNIVGCKSVKTE